MARRVADLKLGGEQLEDVINLVIGPPGKHLVGLVQHEHADAVGTQGTTPQHVIHTPWGPHHHVHAGLFLLYGLFAFTPSVVTTWATGLLRRTGLAVAVTALVLSALCEAFVYYTTDLTF